MIIRVKVMPCEVHVIVSLSRQYIVRPSTYDDGLERVEADILRVRAGDIRDEEGDERGGVEDCGLDGRFEDVTARACMVPFDFVVRPYDTPREEN